MVKVHLKEPDDKIIPYNKFQVNKSPNQFNLLKLFSLFEHILINLIYSFRSQGLCFFGS